MRMVDRLLRRPRPTGIPLTAILPGVFRFNLPWVNMWVVANGGHATVIDTGVRWDRKRIRAGLKYLDCELDSVLLTHAHADHAGNAAFLAREHDASLVCHEAERPFIGTRRTYVPRGIRALGPSGWLFIVGEVAWPVRRRKPDLVVSDGDSVDSPIGPLKVIHLPGHTPGQVGYFCEERRWLFSGDALINVLPVHWEEGLSAPVQLYSTDVQQGLESVRRIAELKPNALFPGHGHAILEDTAAKIESFLERAERA